MMSMRRVIGIIVFAIVIIVAIFLIWYIGSQKTVYSVVVPSLAQVWRG